MHYPRSFSASILVVSMAVAACLAEPPTAQQANWEASEEIAAANAAPPGTVPIPTCVLRGVSPGSGQVCCSGLVLIQGVCQKACATDAGCAASEYCGHSGGIYW